MYSVLIQNQKTLQVFREYYPVFLDQFSKNQIGVCRWVESGRTIDTALPGLGELVEDKEEWRAVIVRMVELDEHDMQKHPFQPDNPYDFKENLLTKNNKLHESGIPLVRLTQMLGEVPAPIQTFKEEVHRETAKAPKMVYTPNGVDEEELQTYKDLVKKYEYDGHKPSDLILITFVSVKRKNDRERTTEVWDQNEERSKGDFARRNWYSSNCRFVKYQYVKEGRTRKEAELFNFWNCVMLLSSTNIDPSSLQAYRLYSTRVIFDKDVMANAFQMKYDELIGCRNYVEEEMRHDAELRMSEKHPKPVYRAEIPMEVQPTSDIDVFVNEKLFRLCPRSNNNELRKWEAFRDIAENGLATIYRGQDRILDESAEQMRTMCEIPEELVTPLDKYEKIEMEAELSRTFDEILRTQNTISDTRNTGRKETNRLADDVKKSIFGRIPGTIAFEIAIVILAFVVVSVIPVFLLPGGSVERRFGVMLVFFLVCALVYWGCEVLLLLAQKTELHKKIDKYNDAMEDNLSYIIQDTAFYSNFVSNIVSFSRGKSFLNTLRHKKFRLETEFELLQRHFREIEVMMHQVEHWSKAFFIPVIPKRNIRSEYIVDIDVSPRNNRLYTFDYGEEVKIPLNYSGDEIVSPFGFIERLIIEREELYKNAGGND